MGHNLTNGVCIIGDSQQLMVIPNNGDLIGFNANIGMYSQHKSGINGNTVRIDGENSSNNGYQWYHLEDVAYPTSKENLEIGDLTRITN